MAARIYDTMNDETFTGTSDVLIGAATVFAASVQSGIGAIARCLQVQRAAKHGYPYRCTYYRNEFHNARPRRRPHWGE